MALPRGSHFSEIRIGSKNEPVYENALTEIKWSCMLQLIGSWRFSQMKRFSLPFDISLEGLYKGLFKLIKTTNHRVPGLAKYGIPFLCIRVCEETQVSVSWKKIARESDSHMKVILFPHGTWPNDILLTKRGSRIVDGHRFLHIWETGLY